MNRIVLIFLVLGVGFFGSCKKRPDPVVAPPSGSTPGTAETGLKIQIANVVNGEPLVLSAKKYTNYHGDTFIVHKYRYYISNVSFENNEGVVFKESEGYYLIDQSIVSSQTFALSNIPDGKYVKMKFLIGVDSARNTSGAQTGALDPINAMFWDWETGYIMAMLEGESPNATPNDVAIHLGGFSGKYNCLRWVELNLPTSLEVSKDKKSVVHLKADLAEWFKTPNTIDLATNALIVGGMEGVQIADNYSDMFTVDSIE